LIFWFSQYFSGLLVVEKTFRSNCKKISSKRESSLAPYSAPSKTIDVGAFEYTPNANANANANANGTTAYDSGSARDVRGPNTTPIQGTYRGLPVTHYVDPNTGLNVIRDASGNFLSGWKLND